MAYSIVELYQNKYSIVELNRQKILLFTQPKMLISNWNDYNAPAWVNSRAFGRWRDITHAPLAGGVS
jgi:hypothetical protein